MQVFTASPIVTGTMSVRHRPHTRARSRSRASSDDVLADADTSAADTDFVLAARSSGDERSSDREGAAGPVDEDRNERAQDAPSSSAARQYLKRWVPVSPRYAPGVTSFHISFSSR